MSRVTALPESAFAIYGNNLVSIGGGKAISLDEVTALNDEMAALARAGVPLELGLSEMGRDLPGRLGELAERMGQRLRSGRSLEQVLSDDRESFPPVWRAVVLAGLRSGHLAAALERLSITARRLAERRRLFGLAMVYPIVVLTLACALFALTAIYVLPVIDSVYRDLSDRTDPLLAVLNSLGIWWIGPVALLALAVLLVGWRRASRSDGGGLRRVGSSKAPHEGRLATFAEILALLVRQQVPLDESVVLAAEASGDRGLIATARDLAERLDQGRPAGTSDAVAVPLPKLLGWMLQTATSPDELSRTLLMTAEHYRQRAERRMAWYAVYMPILLTVVIGGSVTLLYALAVIGPLWRLFYLLSGV